MPKLPYNYGYLQVVKCYQIRILNGKSTVSFKLLTLRDPPEIDFWIYDTLDNNLGIGNDFREISAKKSDGFGRYGHECPLKIAFAKEISPK